MAQASAPEVSTDVRAFFGDDTNVMAVARKELPQHQTVSGRHKGAREKQLQRSSYTTTSCFTVHACTQLAVNKHHMEWI